MLVVGNLDVGVHSEAQGTDAGVEDYSKYIYIYANLTVR